MAKLMYGNAHFDSSKFIVENTIAGNGKNYYIEGIYTIADNRNQNGRIYPERVLMPEVERFLEKYVNEDRAFMELDHPDSPTIGLDRVAGMVVNLEREGKVWYGKSIIGGEKGDAVKKIMDMGGRLGVSSRALGNLDSNNIVSELQIITWDIVHEPSVASAMMKTIVEGKEFNWVTDDNYIFAEKQEKIFKTINKNSLLTKEEKDLYTEMLFNKFFKELLK